MRRDRFRLYFRVKGGRRFVYLCEERRRSDLWRSMRVLLDDDKIASIKISRVK